MQILIIGSSGLLAVNWALCGRKEDEVCLGLHRRVVNISNVNIALINLNNDNSLAQSIDKISQDLIINTAGMTDVDKCKAHEQIVWRVNADYAGLIAKNTFARNKN